MAKKSKGRRGGRRGGRFNIDTNAILAGGLAGLIAPYATKLAGPQFGPAVGMIGTGAFMHNETLQTLGGFALGSRLTSGLPGAATAGGII